MRISKNTLNNMMMENQRRTPLYQAIITDLVIQGCISKEVGETLLGYKIPSFLHTPDGKCLEEPEQPKKKVAKKIEVKEEKPTEEVEE